ncbi:hypothetical protein BS50DRAFT_576148 [Corynespora cassiicola Philippines]|uniref:Uncharacterized protein n=1 Tax=Corynespora cassiicola Philippines TaxID=1448308 RepID=A0A2T2NHM3_CORCC|nr:hypothetical protein BS50DRAFT_576148 [Corynespora cassiicola Philippines]
MNAQAKALGKIPGEDAEDQTSSNLPQEPSPPQETKYSNRAISTLPATPLRSPTTPHPNSKPTKPTPPSLQRYTTPRSRER